MTNQNTRDSYIFYRSFYEAIKELPNENQLEIYNAIAEYSLNFKEVELSGLSKTIFTLIKPQLEANNKRFIVGQKGAKHGKKGGRPKSIKPQNNPNGDKKNYPKETPNKNVNVNENVLNVNNNEECKSKNNIILPDYLDLDIWKEFLSMRKKLKAPNTETALNRILKKLEAFEKQKMGNGTLAIENSIENGWKGVFEPKQKNTTKTNSGDSFDRVLKEIQSEQLKLK
jgi:hypothetical protein|tara:strand:+ start:312 stop:992 length:681 start_codon:yes stop_codon:yes gene_type:complete